VGGALRRVLAAVVLVFVRTVVRVVRRGLALEEEAVVVLRFVVRRARLGAGAGEAGASSSCLFPRRTSVCRLPRTTPAPCV